MLCTISRISLHHISPNFRATPVIDLRVLLFFACVAEPNHALSNRAQSLSSQLEEGAQWRRDKVDFICITGEKNGGGGRRSGAAAAAGGGGEPGQVADRQHRQTGGSQPQKDNDEFHGSDDDGDHGTHGSFVASPFCRIKVLDKISVK